MRATNSQRSPGHKYRALIAAIIAVVALVGSGCGNDSASNSSQTNAADRNGNQIDAVFVSSMVPHHQAAIDMADVGAKRASHAEIKQLSEKIRRSQQAEIDQLNKLETELPDAKSSMMSQQESAGMMSDVDSLTQAKNFDKAFIDAMVPHHQSAVTMANQVIADGTSPEVMKLAKAIVAAQSEEIAEMQTWRTEWFGSPLPAQPSSSMNSPHSGH